MAGKLRAGACLLNGADALRKAPAWVMLLRMRKHQSIGLPRRSGTQAPASVLSLALGMAAGAVLALLARIGTLSPPRLQALVGAEAIPVPGIDLPWHGPPAPAAEIQAADMDRLVTLVGAGVALVLVVAAVNLVVAAAGRAVARRQGMAVRYALGPSRWRMAKPLLLEGVVLAVLGAAVAAALVVIALPALLVTAPVAVTARPDLAFAAACLGAPVLLTVLLSLLPAVDVWTLPSWPRLVAGERATAAPGTRLLWGLLLAGQTACAVGVLYGAGLLLADARAAGRDGAVADGVVVARASAEPAALAEAVPALLDRLGVPGRASAGVASAGAIEGVGPRHFVMTECMCVMANMYVPIWFEDPMHFSVSEGFFDTLGLGMVAGRSIRTRDDADGLLVVVVNQAFVDGGALGREPLARSIQLGGANAPWYRVVGIVENAHHTGPGAGTGPTPAIYLSVLQHPPREAVIAIRTEAGDAIGGPDVRVVALAEVPGAALGEAETLTAVLERFAAPARWLSGILAWLGVAAAALATLGAFAMSRDLVRQRRQELGIRLAMGATPLRLAGTILAGLARPLAGGIGFGVLATLSVARGLELTGTEALLGLALALAGVVLAGAVPALADSRRLDPARLLRGL